MYITDNVETSLLGNYTVLLFPLTCPCRGIEIWHIMYMYVLNLHIADLSGLEIELVGQLVSVYQINSVVVMNFGIPLPAVVERFLHYLEQLKIDIVTKHLVVGA